MDFEALARQSARFTRILVSGVRADDMALRLKYAGFDTGRIEVIRDYENLLEAIGADETPTFIMPTYTAARSEKRWMQTAMISSSLAEGRILNRKSF